MIYNLPANNLYSNKPVELNIPDNWKVDVCEYHGKDCRQLSYEEIENSILSQTDIRSKAKGAGKAVIIVDDISRPTPLEQISKIIINELHEAGIKDDDIYFMFATGMHRAMSYEEMVIKLGKDICNRYAVYCHNPFFNNITIGESEYGFPIEVNQSVAKTDFKIAIGSITPHSAVGVASGSKIILPGISSVNSIKAFHEKTRKDRWNINSIGKQMADEFSKAIGLNIKIDVLLNGKGEISKVFVDKPEDIIVNNYKEIVEFFRCPSNLDADIFLINNYFKPSEISLALAGNGLLSHLPDNSTVIISSHTPQGSAAHYLFGSWGEYDNEGLLYRGIRKLPNNIKRYIVFSDHFDRGYGKSWHYENVEWFDNWDEIVKSIGSDRHKMVIYPYASVSYFSDNGNIE